MQREQAKMPILKVLSGRGLQSTAYTPSCCPSMWLLTSLQLGSDCNPPFWDTDRSWHTLNYWSLKNQRWWLGQLKSFEKQLGAQAGLIDKVHLLHETSKDWKKWLF